MSSWGYSAPTQGTVSIGTATTSVLSANANRRYLLLQNDGTTDIYLKLGTAAAVLNNGIRLVAGGGAYEMSRGAANIYSGAIQGIAGAAATRLMYAEGTA